MVVFVKRIGFTGSQHGISVPQWVSLNKIADGLEREEDEIWLHHGDCIGADQMSHMLSLCRNYSVVIHPPEDDKKRAYCTHARETREPKPYLVRNHDIVDETEMLIATPSGPETLRSGTWATIRYARKLGRPVTIIWPDGRVDSPALAG